MVTFLKDCNTSKRQEHLMIFYHPRDGDCPRDGHHHMYDEHPRDVGYHRLGKLV